MRWTWVWLMTAACGATLDPAPAGGGGAVPVQALTLVRSSAPVDVASVGTVVPDEQVVVRADVAGRVVHVGFEDGDAVRAGTVLVRLDDVAARAALAEAEASRTLAAQRLARVEALSGAQNASADELDVARAELALAEARRDAAADTLADHTVRAPFSGVVAQRLVTVGDRVDASVAITTLVDADPLDVVVDLPEQVAGWARVGQSADVLVPGASQGVTQALVRYVAPALDPATRTLRVLVALPPGTGLSAGATAQATVHLAPPEPVLAVPAEALATRADGTVVWVLTDGKAQVRQVRTGARRVSDVVILEGLVEGDRVIVQGLARLREGIAVREVAPPTADVGDAGASAGGAGAR